MYSDGFEIIFVGYFKADLPTLLQNYRYRNLADKPSSFMDAVWIKGNISPMQANRNYFFVLNERT